TRSPGVERASGAYSRAPGASIRAIRLPGVGDELSGGDAGDRAGLVLVGHVAGDTDGADDRAAVAVADQHTAGRGDHAPVRHGVERREERLLLRLLGHASREGSRARA